MTIQTEQSNETVSISAETIIKAAKKILKKSSEDDATMKLKSLVKNVVEKVGSNKSDVKKILVAEKDLFTIDEDGKQISLKSSGKKRKQAESGEEEDTDKAAKKKAKKEAKKAKKKEKANKNSVTGDSSFDVTEWRSENKIVLKDYKNKTIAGGDTYKPMHTFDSCESRIAQQLLDHCTKTHKFSKPSPIQSQTWPVLLAPEKKNQGVVGIAETGSGKTLAFSMPALSKMYESDCKGKKQAWGRLPRMLILAPTRELAMQSHETLVDFGKVVNLTSVVVYGGVPKHTQKDTLRKGVDCVVATPGRLKDLINENVCNLGDVRHLVLDEADRMLDMGFEEDVKYIIAQCPDSEKRQTAMFSATWPAAIQKMAGDYMVDPIRVYVGFEAIVGSNGENSIDDSLSANKRVTQTVEVIEDRAREPRLRELLRKYHSKRDNRVLVFALYKKEAQRIENNLNRDGWKCCSIHGDKSQEARTKALSEFKDGSCPLLIATDVAARGLDIPNVEAVINFTFPLTIEDYVHRIGRTGRAGKTGISYTMFQPGDKSHAGELQQVMRQAGQAIPDELMAFGSTIKKKEHKLYGNFGPKNGPMKKAVKITFDSDDE